MPKIETITACKAKQRLVALLLLGTASSGIVFAAEPDGAEDTISEEKEVELPTITVTEESAHDPTVGFVVTSSTAGTKTDTPLIETPQSISVITNAQMEVQNVSNLAEALRYTPGVNAEAFGFEPRLTWIRMRGFDVTTTGLFRDGLKLNNPGFAIGYSLEPYGAERLEVPRGPASVLYGQAGPGGLVNYVSKRPIFDPFGEIKFEAGSFDRFQGEFDVGGAIDQEKTLAYRLTGLFRGSETQVDFIQDNRIFVAPALTWKPGDNTSWTFLGHYQKDNTKSSQRLPAQGTLFFNPNGEIPTERFTGEPNIDGYDREEFSVTSLFEHRFNDVLTVRQNARYYLNKVDDRTIFPTALLADLRTVSRTLFESFGQVNAFTLDNMAQFDFSTGPLDHTLLSGVDFQYTDAEILQTFGAAPNLDIYNPVYGAAVALPPTFRNEDVIQDQVGLYLQDQIAFGEKWRVSLGGRYDFAHSETHSKLTDIDSGQEHSAFTGRAGLVYLADNGLAPYFSYATSFLPVLGTDVFGNVFVPETGEQYEFGIKYQPAGYNSFMTLAFFDLTRKNFLTPDPVTLINVQRGEARSRGVELEGVASLENGINLTASYAYLDTEVTESSFAVEIGEPLEYAPKHQAKLWADYTVQSGMASGLGIGGGVRYIGTSFGNSFAARNDLKIPGVTLFDTTVHYDFEQFSFAVNIHNVLDKEYVATGFTAGGDFATFGLRRMVTGSIKYSF